MPLSLGFFPGLLLRFAASEEVGEEADEDVAELGLAFFDLRVHSDLLMMEARVCCFVFKRFALVFASSWRGQCL